MHHPHCRVAHYDQEPGTRNQEPGTRNQEPGTRNQEPGTSDCVAYPLEGKRILVLDDDISILESMKQFLELYGSKVFTFNHGQGALAWLEEQEEICDAVLTDIRMPIMDGFSVARHIRQTLGLGDIPIIAVTGESVNETSSEFASAGFTAVMKKPFDPDAILQLLGTHVY